MIKSWLNKVMGFPAEEEASEAGPEREEGAEGAAGEQAAASDASKAPGESPEKPSESAPEPLSEEAEGDLPGHGETPSAEEGADEAEKDRTFSEAPQQEPPAEAQNDANAQQGEGQQEEEGGLFSRLKHRLSKSRQGFVRQLDRIFLGKRQIDPELMEELEELLVMSDMGVATVQEIFQRLQEEVDRRELTDPPALKQRLQELLKELFARAEEKAGEITWQPAPFVVLVVGVNGVGKTTTIAKLAWQLKNQGKKVMLVAADTFRAAAVEQLKMWGDRVGVPVISHKSGSDPSAVAFDGMEAARAKGVDVVIVDTAGRLHTQVNLMEELKKIHRVLGKKLPGAPHEVLLVLDATTGQNALQQAKLFNQAVPLTGLALTKLDGTAKGGVVVAIAGELGLPICYAGLGEGVEDLKPFDPGEFAEAIF